MMTKLELLAPAKNLECGIAAIDHGADAVYIGPERFGARVAAGNSLDDIRTLCLYAHQFAVKVFATVNTLLHDNEVEPARQLIWQLYEAGVDAILVQDLQLLNQSLPPVALHASTQTDNRTAEKVRQLQQLGFRRVVLARELSVDEIAAIHREVPDMPLEVFVHGALCVSYSGQCYISEYCFGRSANRGACAQVCRMSFDLLDAEDRVLEHDRYLLSLKDLNLSDHLQELIDAGATSFKIEGRLKDVAYVKNVTAAYSERLNDIIRRHPDRYERASLGRCTYTFKPDLRKTFNRGYTTHFLHGRQPDIFSPDTPKAIGEFVGTVKEIRGRSFTVAGTARFANGDGLCFHIPSHPLQGEAGGGSLQGFRVNRVEGNRLFPLEMPDNLRPGMKLYRNNDMEFERILSRSSAERKIPIRMQLSVTPTGYALHASLAEPRSQADNPSSHVRWEASAHIDCEHQQAEKPQRDNIVRQLTKLGGTPYECQEVLLPDDFNYFIPSSKLSELRRKTIVKTHPQPLPVREGSKYLQGNECNSTPPSQGGAGGESPSPLMQCRHCLRYALGYCTKNPNSVGKPPLSGRFGAAALGGVPLYLRLRNGRRFRLDFDCKNCQMNVYAEN